MPPRDKPIKNQLMALGSAAVLAVYGAGFVRTRSAAERFDGEDAVRRPAAGGASHVPVAQVQSPTVDAVPDQHEPSASKTAATSKISQDPPAVAGPLPAGASQSVRIQEFANSGIQASQLHVSDSQATSAVLVEKTPVSSPAPPVPVDTSHATPVAARNDSAAAARPLRDGTYTGWGTSRHGDIQSSVTVKDGRIVSASIAQCLTRYSCSWISALPPQVVARQSAEVDYVSGATQSSNAFYYGVLEALKQAK